MAIGLPEATKAAFRTLDAKAQSCRQCRLSQSAWLISGPRHGYVHPILQIGVETFVVVG
jgi:hypothetical protein